jgi:hypothetical protein
MNSGELTVTMDIAFRIVICPHFLVALFAADQESTRFIRAFAYRSTKLLEGV